MSYSAHLLTELSLYLILALSLNLIVGYCGLLTLAHGAFYAIGAYACALVTLTRGWGFVPALLLAAGVSALAGGAQAILSWRLKGDLFVLASLAVLTLTSSLLHNWYSPDAELGTWANLTNGPYGLSGVPRPELFGSSLSGGGLALLAALLAGLSLALTARLGRAPWGRMLQAVRDDELAARGLGKCAVRARTQAIMVACALAGVTGALQAARASYVDDSLCSVDASVLLLCMVLLGGTGNQVGPMVGAVLLVALREGLRWVPLPEARLAALRLLVYGAALVLLMRFRPRGLAGSYSVE